MQPRNRHFDRVYYFDIETLRSSFPRAWQYVATVEAGLALFQSTSSYTETTQVFLPLDIEESWNMVW